MRTFSLNVIGSWTICRASLRLGALSISCYGTSTRRSALHGMPRGSKISDEKVSEAVTKAKVRLVRLRDALADLHEASEGETRSRAVGFRGSEKAVSAVLGR